ncbi:MAG: MFS transporter [Dehalococcoidia bacterium]|nr:MFS transporter [Dehalococcoidia bacterium]
MSKLRAFINISLVDFSARLSYNIARTPLLPLFALALGASPSLIGVTVAASTITGIFLKAPAGALSDSIGRKRMLLFGACVFAFTPFSYAAAAVAWVLVLIRVIHGIATSIYGPVANAVVAEIAGGEKGKYLSLFAVIKIATNALGGLAGGWLLYVLSRGGDYTIGNFHDAYAICGALGIAALVLAIFLLPQIEQSSGNRRLSDAWQKVRDGLKATVKNRSILMTSSMESFQNMTMGAAMAFLPILVVQQYRFSVLQAGILWSVVAGSSVGLKPVMGYLSDRIKRWKLVSLGMIVCALSFTGFSLTANYHLLLLVAIAFGWAEAIVTSSTVSYVADLASEKNLGASLGVFGTIADAGQAVGPIVVGLLLGFLSYFGSLSIVSVVILLWTAAYVVLQLRETRA